VADIISPPDEAYLQQQVGLVSQPDLSLAIENVLSETVTVAGPIRPPNLPCHEEWTCRDSTCGSSSDLFLVREQSMVSQKK
jgi:hypothetical protein